MECMQHPKVMARLCWADWKKYYWFMGFILALVMTPMEIQIAYIRSSGREC